MNSAVLKDIVSRLMSPGEGFLAIDENLSTIKKRFDKIDLENSEENRRTYRELLITAPGIEQYVSGMILFDETVFQRTSTGVLFPDFLKSKEIVTMVKVDMGRAPLAFHLGEKIVEGIDGLGKRLEKYKEMGAEALKFRSEIYIGPDMPSDYCLYTNMHLMGRYAAMCQELDMVPVMEPEVMITGDHTIDVAEKAVKKTLKALFAELPKHGVDIAGAILKTSMVISGDTCFAQAASEEVAKATANALKAVVPKELGGIVFLSGGQTPLQATENLQAIEILGPYPWPLSFSYGRALQASALEYWQGQKENYDEAQKLLLKRCKMNSLAVQGKYSPEMENE